MLSHFPGSISLSSSLSTARRFLPLCIPPPPSFSISASRSPLTFLFRASNLKTSRLRTFSGFSTYSRGIPMDSGSVIANSSVESIADDLKNQSLGDVRVKSTLEDLNWENSFVRELPADPSTDNIPRQVFRSCYTKVSPSAEVEDPKLVAWSESVAELLDLDPKEFERPDFPLIFSGASPLAGSEPYAQCYGGHQFGVWAGQLGDGRAITLGEVLNSKSKRWELQLKGAGKTPYSRFADGLAVLRSSIREFLCSEAMHHLGIPTTRALSLVMTGKLVRRDMFYDGNPKDEPGAIVCRVAPSFLRFGSYQLHASRGKVDLDIVRALADYTIRHHFPHIDNMSKSDSLSFSIGEEDGSIVDLTSNKYAAWAVEVAERTATLVSRWQGVGFTHGVLNTDNMSVLGLTIDYGPYGFLDAFDPSYTPNTTDLPGRRYCFANQPDIGLWNIAQFASTLSTANLLNDKEANYVMERYGIKFMDDYQAIMTKKLGLPKYNKQLIGDLLNNMAVDKVDYTNFFRLLSNIKADPSIPEDELLIPLKAVLLDIGKSRKDAWTNWVQSYIHEVSASGVSNEDRKASMNAVNPKYILRNYLCQGAIDGAEQGNFEEVRRLLKVMERPYDDQPGMETYARLPPAWAYRPGVGMLSCSS
ncbi:protein adenylyltransferase SelO [Impatiens glandulifera]|uniref:protein adenylyltransferase SelO n=1 Tax=Impatiens glandulifera TaxID=253017 RepID=UPI001FB0D61B|nr:protein adenylyltransferase SelO [Impatiens glandulifera]